MNKDRPKAAPDSPGTALLPSVRLQGRYAVVVTKPIYNVKPDPALFLAAMLQDLLNHNLVGHWLRRAVEWDAIDPFVALQCRRKAFVLAEYADDEISPEVWDALTDVTR